MKPDLEYEYNNWLNYLSNIKKLSQNSVVSYKNDLSKFFIFFQDYIEKNIGDKFIGWPTMSELGGYCVDNILDEKDPEGTKLRISLYDRHPNASGHKFIADFLYDKYREIYS